MALDIKRVTQFRFTCNNKQAHVKLLPCGGLQSINGDYSHYDYGEKNEKERAINDLVYQKGWLVTDNECYCCNCAYGFNLI